MGVLYVVATPIGNMQDITPRALEMLQSVGLILAEDTRHTGIMLKRLGVSNRLVSYHQFNARSRESLALAALAVGDVALVTDSGTPAVSDPGALLVRAVVEAGYTVAPLPGPSASVAAWSVAGMPEEPFVTAGFLPRKKKERQELVDRVRASGFGLVIFESPTRTAATLTELAETLGNRSAVVCRELTKLHEEIIHGTLVELAERYRQVPPRGEIVIVVSPQHPEREINPARALQLAIADGLSPSAAARRVAGETGLPRSTLYGLIKGLPRASIEAE